MKNLFIIFATMLGAAMISCTPKSNEAGQNTDTLTADSTEVIDIVTTADTEDDAPEAGTPAEGAADATTPAADAE